MYIQKQDLSYVTVLEQMNFVQKELDKVFRQETPQAVHLKGLKELDREGLSSPKNIEQN